MRDRSIQRANVLVRSHLPHYAEMLERARREPGEALPDVGGIWVPEAWIRPAGYVGAT